MNMCESKGESKELHMPISVKTIPLRIREGTTKKLMRISLRQNVEHLEGTRAKGGEDSERARMHARG